MSKKARIIAVIAFALSFAVVISACADDAPQRSFVPNDRVVTRLWQ